jgi:Ni/Fe-hydrogenase subunit HybB-like protein
LDSSAFGIAFGLLQLLSDVGGAGCSAKGVGVWGIRIPVMWGFAIINFVWWIGIGHAGTLISAILLLLNQSWRNSINRFAEAMTLFAVACAGMFPSCTWAARGWFYWLFPVSQQHGPWPQFRSPLVWDVFAVSTYATVSLAVLVRGPDARSGHPARSCQEPHTGEIYLRSDGDGLARIGAALECLRNASLLLAGMATPLVLSVHTVVSFDFTVAIVPGWHSTFFPPYFVAGAIYSGFAMVLALAIPLRAAYGLQGLITDQATWRMPPR